VGPFAFLEELLGGIGVTPSFTAKFISHKHLCREIPMRFAMTLATAAVLATPLQAQLYKVPDRHGLWAGAGLAAGSIGAICDGCGDNRVFGPAAYLRAGGTLTEKLLLGVELTGWGMDDGGVRQGLGSAMVDLFWYPTLSADFHLKFGVGGLTYERRTEVLGTTQTTTETAGAVSLGVGYDLRVGGNVSLVPFLNLYGSADVKRKVNGTEVITGGDFRRDMVQLGLGLTLH
jgi:hypothetical protein